MRMIKPFPQKRRPKIPPERLSAQGLTSAQIRSIIFLPDANTTEEK